MGETPSWWPWPRWEPARHVQEAICYFDLPHSLPAAQHPGHPACSACSWFLTGQGESDSISFGGACRAAAPTTINPTDVFLSASWFIPHRQTCHLPRPSFSSAPCARSLGSCCTSWSVAPRGQGLLGVVPWPCLCLASGSCPVVHLENNYSFHSNACPLPFSQGFQLDVLWVAAPLLDLTCNCKLLPGGALFALALSVTFLSSRFLVSTPSIPACHNQVSGWCKVYLCSFLVPMLIQRMWFALTVFIFNFLVAQWYGTLWITWN